MGGDKAIVSAEGGTFALTGENLSADHTLKKSVRPRQRIMSITRQDKGLIVGHMG
jgi:hypothetical protein